MRAALFLMLLALAPGVTGCRAILGIDDDPPLLGAGGGGGGPGHGGSSGVGAGAAGSGGDGGAGQGGTAEVDPTWAQWRVPADAPPLSSYERTDDTVLDEVTGLMWQRAAGPLVAGADVDGHCASIDAGGFHDWRLPSRIELETLLDLGTWSPTIEPDAFPGTPDEAPDSVYWTSSFDATLDPGSRLGVDFAGGGIDRLSPSESASVRCVRVARRDPVPAAHYDVATGVVRDNWTGLTWAREPSPLFSTADEMTAHCEGLALGPFESGWRVPTVKELLTLWNETATTGPLWDKRAFGEGPMSTLQSDRTWIFWSATPFASLTAWRWGVDFQKYAGIGSRTTEVITEGEITEDDHPVRCVHD
jgi:hypothetical protein